MNLRTTITFSGPLGEMRLDGSQVRGLRGTQLATVVGQPVGPEGLQMGDVAFRREEVEAYLTRMTGLEVHIETEVT